MEQPLVSVVTTCYRHAPYLPDYFEGLLAQTYPNIELIFLDDGSPDDSWDVAKQYESALRARLSRVVMLRQENLGMFAAIQRVSELATGEFVCILESDDYYLPTKIEENVRVITGARTLEWSTATLSGCLRAKWRLHTIACIVRKPRKGASFKKRYGGIFFKHAQPAFVVSCCGATSIGIAIAGAASSQETTRCPLT